MGNMKKRIAMFVTAAAMAATAVTGCGSKINNDAVVATVGEDKVTMGVANFFARYQQAVYEAQLSMYTGGKNFWDQKVTDTETWEQNVKESVLDDLERMYVLEDHMSEYKVALTDDDNAKIEKAAKAFLKANGEKEKEVISADEETVKHVLSLITIEQKMRMAMVADVDTKVSDKEAAQKSLEYVFFSFTTKDEDGKTTDMTDEEKAELKKTAEEFVKGAKKVKNFKDYAKEKGYTATKKTFDAKETSPSEELIKAADALKVGEFTDIIDAGDGYYVAKVTSLLDKEATEAEKKAIVNKRQADRFTELMDEMLKETKLEVNKEEWAKISFTKERVTFKPDETSEK